MDFLIQGGIGKYIADWMIDGEPPYGLTELDQGRYGNWTSKEYVMAKTRESYGLNNQIGHPKLERPAGRPVRKNGIFEVRFVFRSKSMTRLEANQSKRSHHQEPVRTQIKTRKLPETREM